jgi:hypothetical protein
MTFAGILLLVGVLIFLKKGFYSKIRFLEIPATIAFFMLFIGVFVAIYIFPLIIYFKK